MRRLRALTLLIALSLLLAPALAFARAGGGSSFGSRGSMTYSAPPPTATAPSYAAPMQRSLTPPPMAPSPGYGYGAAPSYGMAGGGRSPFMSGLMGGLIGAGIGGLLFGGGLFHGISGFGSFLGLLLQIGLVFLIGRWLMRKLLAPRQPVMAGGSLFAAGPPPRPAGRGGAARPAPIPITQADYAAFEQVLQAVQAAWSAHDLATLRRVCTPEMVSYFAEQLAEQASRQVRNLVQNVRLEQGDLAEAWAEPGREYATVAMRFSMTDVTVDAAGRVVDGDLAERVQATEIWTFLRAVGGNWLLSAIQQAG